MTRHRPGLGGGLLLAVIGTATTLAALTAWRGFVSSPTDFLAPTLAVGLAVAGLGAVLRSLGTPWPVVVLGQLVVGISGWCWTVTGSPAPIGAPAASAVRSLLDAVETAQTYAAPITADVPPVTPLLVLAGVTFVLLVDVIAGTARRVPIAGLPLLAIYSLPAGVSEDGPGLLAFVAAAAGFLTMLHLDARARLLHWGRTLGPDEHNPWTETNPLADAVRAGVGRIGVSATALAVVLTPFVPVADLPGLGIGGGGSDDITIRKPIADLRRDLERGEDIPMVRVHTDAPDPRYLRVAVLNRFTGNEWSSGDRDVASDQTADGTLPPPQGLADGVPRSTYDYRVDIADDFDSTWLPTAFPITAIDADGDWRYDEDTLDFIAVDDENAAGMSYDMTAVRPHFGTDGRWFANSSSNMVDPEVLDVPGSLPTSVRSLAIDVTQDGLNDYERARLLQSFFRTDGGFRYSIDRAPEGSIGQTLETFLADTPAGRVGYCEQFAAAMAIMARVVGIPARVAIGFLEPTRVGEDEYEFSSHDLHAWPELYFTGAGWVRFEPTPPRISGDAPGYSTVPVHAGDDGGPDDPGQQPSADPGVPTDRPSDAAPTAAPEAGAADDETDADSGGTDRGVGAWLLLVGLLLVIAMFAALPRALRRRQRAARLAGDAEAQWGEVRATVLDLGQPWPQARSPRETGTALAERIAPGDPEADQALRHLVAALEQTRYARAGTVAVLTPELSTATLLTALEAAATPRDRRRATWWPRSLWSG